MSELHPDIHPELLIKSLTAENWLEPDPASSIWVRQSVVGPIHIKPHEWAKQLLAIDVDESVPLDVRRLFAVARGATLYGSFFYPLWTLGSERLFIVGDAAIGAKYEALGGTRKAKGQLPPYHDRIDWLRKRGVLDDFSFKSWDRLRKLRNSAAHPETQTLFMPTHALTWFAAVARDINALFANPSQ